MTAIAHSAPHSSALPAATVRSQVSVPLRFVDGYATTAVVMTFHGLVDGREHLLLALGNWEQALLGGATAPLVRLHSECMTGDVFGSERCDCGPQLREAVERIAAAGGFLLYLRQEGRGIGLPAKIHAYKLQEEGFDTIEANEKLGFGSDLRDYGMGAQILHDLGVRKMRLMTNNPKKIIGLEGYGLEIVEQLPIRLPSNPHNEKYLETKRTRMGHTL